MLINSFKGGNVWKTLHTVSAELPELRGRFLSGSSAQQLGRVAIVTAAGTIVGFEVRPLYTQPAFGTSDVLDILYHQQAQGSSVSIRLRSAVERQLSGN